MKNFMMVLVPAMGLIACGVKVNYSSVKAWGQDSYLRPLHSGKCIDAAGWGTASGTHLVQWDCHGGKNQKFRFTFIESDIVMLENIHSGKCLAAIDASITLHSQVVLEACDKNAKHQQLKWISAPNDSISLAFMHSGLCLDVQGSSKENGAKLLSFQCGGDKGVNQQFWTM